MKMKVSIKVLGIALILTGGLMAERINKLPSHPWVKVVDKQAELEIEFPRQPLETNFELPFQNTPSIGNIHLYSVPTNTGIFVLSTLTSSSITLASFQKEELEQVFKTILVPHLFYNPNTFYNEQVFTYTPQTINGKSVAFIEVSYRDHDITKKLKGIAQVKGHTLCTYFYLASEQDFDEELLEHFLFSAH